MAAHAVTHDPPAEILFGNLHELVRVGGDLSHTLTFVALDANVSWDAWMTGDLPVDIAAAAGGIDYSEILVVERALDEDGEEEMRIVRGDLRAGAFTRLASAPRTDRYDAWWLVAQGDGAYALVASSTRRDEHAVARIELVPSMERDDDEHGLLSVRVTSIERGAGAIVAPPVGSLRGVTVGANDRGAWRALTYTFRDRPRRDLHPHGDHDRDDDAGELEDLF